MGFIRALNSWICPPAEPREREGAADAAAAAAALALAVGDGVVDVAGFHD